jgi:hypothetical protein
LKNDINLSIKEDSEKSNKNVGDDNMAGMLISVKVQTAIRLARPARNRQLPAKYK